MLARRRNYSAACTIGIDQDMPSASAAPMVWARIGDTALAIWSRWLVTPDMKWKVSGKPCSRAPSRAVRPRCRNGWEGARLAITAEVKQYILKEDGVEQLAGFANEANARGSIGIVFTLGFEEGVRKQVEDLGVKALDIDDMQTIVSLWDPMKQRIAIASMTYYVKHVEKSSALGARLGAFITASIEAFHDGESADDIPAPSALLEEAAE